MGPVGCRPMLVAAGGRVKFPSPSLGSRYPFRPNGSCPCWCLGRGELDMLLLLLLIVGVLKNRRGLEKYIL